MTSREQFAGTPLEALDWGTDVSFVQDIADRTLTVGFMPAGETVRVERDDHTTVDWTDFQKTQTLAALATFQEIIGFSVEVVDADDAEFRFASTPIEGLSAQFGPPGTLEDGHTPGLGIFNSAIFETADGGPLLPGARNFKVLVHELGHGLGLAHPHDNGGPKGDPSPKMHGVVGKTGESSLGDYALNQGAYTVMSYNQGWHTGPAGAVENPYFGNAAGPMALDIAVLQAKYGANMSHATGDDVYVLPGDNKFGTGYRAIWDAGGVDTIVNTSGTSNKGGTVIDLRPATLEYERGGGGFVSHISNTLGGFTIAAGVVIENAVGGNTADRIVGNAVGNALEGGSGNDRLFGLLGHDSIEGGGGADRIVGGRGNDTMMGNAGADNLFGGRGDDLLFGLDDGFFEDSTAISHLHGGPGDDVFALNFPLGWTVFTDVDRAGVVIEDFSAGDRIALPDSLTYADLEFAAVEGDVEISSSDIVIAVVKNATLADLLEERFIELESLPGRPGDDDDMVDGTGADELLESYAGDDTVLGRIGDDTLRGGSGDDELLGGAGSDRALGGDGADRLIGGADGDTLAGGTGADTVIGGEGDDVLYGGAGADRLFGGPGDDTLVGGTGLDTARGGTGADTFMLEAGDGHLVITDFTTGEDLIGLRAISPADLVVGNRTLAILDESDGSLDLLARFTGGVDTTTLTDLDFV